MKKKSSHENQFDIQHCIPEERPSSTKNKSCVGENVCGHNQLLISQEIKKNNQAKKLSPSLCYLKLA